MLIECEGLGERFGVRVNLNGKQWIVSNLHGSCQGKAHMSTQADCTIFRLQLMVCQSSTILYVIQCL